MFPFYGNGFDIDIDSSQEMVIDYHFLCKLLSTNIYVYQSTTYFQTAWVLNGYIVHDII